MFIINNYNSFISTDIPGVQFKPSELIFLTDLKKCASLSFLS